MPSPFPGMDPWLEDPGVFPDVHDTLIVGFREAVNAVLPAPYFARTATRVYRPDEPAHREPDVSVVDPAARRPAADPAAAFEAGGLIAIELPPADPVEERFLEVRSTRGDRLVTSVEVLSLANKLAGRGRDEYEAKQDECRAAGVGLVEVDLLRRGRHATVVPRNRLRAVARDAVYHVCVSGRAVGRRVYVAPVRLADPLPRVPVPLDPGVPPVVVDLQPLLDRCYDTGLYARQLRYARPCRPRLTADQQAWADAALRNKGLVP